MTFKIKSVALLLFLLFQRLFVLSHDLLHFLARCIDAYCPSPGNDNQDDATVEDSHEHDDLVNRDMTDCSQGENDEEQIAKLSKEGLS